MFLFIEQVFCAFAEERINWAVKEMSKQITFWNLRQAIDVLDERIFFITAMSDTV